MNKSALIIVSMAILVVLIGLLWRADPYKNSNILFYVQECDHCMVVDSFIEKNKVASAISFVRLEVLQDTRNESILLDKARMCGLDDRHIGVPFFWEATTQKCVLGDADIVAFFKNKLGEKP